MRHRISMAFTLVELLVVIAIMLLLLSVLLPALGKARDMAKEVKCVSNLRNIGQVQQVYAQDYNGYATPRYDDPATPSGNSWQGILRNLNYLPAIKNESVFKCPLISYGDNLTSNSIIARQGYGMQARNFGFWPENLFKVSSPSTYILVGDVRHAFNDYGSWVWYNDAATNLHKLHTRHSNKCIVVLGDGHVERWLRLALIGHSVSHYIDAYGNHF